MPYITIPAEITAAEDKIAYALRVVELLRIEHNKKGAAVDKEDPAALKTFHDWQTNVFEPVQQEAIKHANDAKQILYADHKHDAAIDAAAMLAARETDL